jgi:hypothetical protein
MIDTGLICCQYLPGNMERRANLPPYPKSTIYTHSVVLASRPPLPSVSENKKGKVSYLPDTCIPTRETNQAINVPQSVLLPLRTFFLSVFSSSSLMYRTAQIVVLCSASANFAKADLHTLERAVAVVCNFLREERRLIPE